MFPTMATISTSWSPSWRRPVRPVVAHAGLALDLAGDDEHGDGIGPGAEDSVEGVDAAGAGGDVDHAGLSADAGVGFGGHGGRLLVVIANVVNARLLANGVVEVHGAAAGDQEDVAHAPIRELADDVVGKLHTTSAFDGVSSERTGLLSPRRRI